MKNLIDSTENLDKKNELILGNILRTGVIIAGCIMLIGAILFLIRHGNEFPHYHSFKLDLFDITNPNLMLKGLFELKSIALMQLGVFVLIATPVIRVIVSVIAFLYEKDFMYVVFTLIVLTVLLYSIFFS